MKKGIQRWGGETGSCGWGGEAVVGVQVLASHPLAVLDDELDDWNNILDLCESAVDGLGLEKLDSLVVFLAVQEGGVHGAWGDAVVGDLLLGVLGRGLGQPVHGGLGGLVDGVAVGVGAQEGGGEHHDRAVLRELSLGLSQEEERGGDVDGNHLVVLVERDVCQALSQHHADVVDGEVDLAEGLDAEVKQPRGRVLRGEVALVGGGRDAVLLGELVCQLLGFRCRRRRVVVEQEVRALLGEGLCCLLAEVLVGACDDRCFAAEHCSGVWVGV